MKPTTKICVGIKHIGAPTDEPAFFNGDIATCLVQIAEYLAKRSMAVRFDLVIHRNEDEARRALLGLRQHGGAANGLEDLQATLSRIMTASAENVEKEGN